MRTLLTALLAAFAAAFPASAKVVVFWQPGFPTIASRPVTRATLERALEGMGPVFAGLDELRTPATLAGARLLVLPYGSAAPTQAWKAIRAYLRTGGNLLALGGQPFRVPVTNGNGGFTEAPPQDTYSREIGIPHTYEAPDQGASRFAWRTEYSFLRPVEVRARRFFVLEGRLSGLGFMVNSEGLEVAAPVVVIDRAVGGRGSSGPASRMVMLDFDPAEGYWESADGVSLIRQTAAYARRGVAAFSLEMPYSTIRPGEAAKVVIHLRKPAPEARITGEVRLELRSGNTTLETLTVLLPGGESAATGRVDKEAAFSRRLGPGFYTIRGVWRESGESREAYQNGLWVQDGRQLATGPVLGADKDFLTRDGKPFLPVGANYFSTEADGWDFGGPRNAWIWDRDLDEMQRYGVTFVRTGVWTPTPELIDPATKGVTERFLRNLEAFLLSAHRHNIAVNFTFYAFTPRPLDAPAPQTNSQPASAGRPSAAPPEPNVYLDPAALKSELNYVLSIVNRFKDAPWLCWDLINEPSFSNPGRLWTGNTPNGDPIELAQWRKWLATEYSSFAELSSAWRVTPEQLGSFDGIPLPSISNLSFDRYRNAGMVRAFDYNLFAQEMFTRWVRQMVAAIRATGSRQLINVGQDEGGVTNRVLNQFYAAGGVDFTTNHTYWQDDALLWDSIAAKRPGMPNIVGETGYQPVRSADSTWRYDELTGTALNERKWALGFAAGSSGAVMWDWDREVDFGIKRSDGSAKILQGILRAMGRFAAEAEPYATALIQPEAALVLPQSFQLSVYGSMAVAAQQRAVRALYQYARGEAYTVGEYQIELLGNPKLIILPSPKGLAASAWEAIRGKVEAGATLLVSGPFDGDQHFHPTGRERQAGLNYQTVPLLFREEFLEFPGGQARLSYGGNATTYLDRAALPDNSLWAEKTLGKGKILFSPLPLELNDNLAAIGAVYRYAMKAAGVAPAYSTTVDDSGILICPMNFPRATLYVLTSESGRSGVSFTDGRSGRTFSGALKPGRSALLLIGLDGTVLASYNWAAA